MLLTRREPIRDDDTAGTLAVRLAEIGAEALIEALAQLEGGTAIETPQDHAIATYAPLLTKAHGQVDWTRTATEVRDLVRGADPWPGATTTLKGEPLKLYGATSAEASEGARNGASHLPGQALTVDGRGVVIACAAGAVRIAQLQVAGGRRMPAAELARGHGLAAGSILGA
jgi:methionyl-tRNA formyltransferase